jgi:hypothetical protein
MHVTFPYTRCRVGIAKRDVTPPVGIYARSWGAATHEAAEGVHRPFYATAAVFAPLEGEGQVLVLIALDIGGFPYVPDNRALRAKLAEAAGVNEAAVVISMSHTHAGARVNTMLEGAPGTDLIKPYYERLTELLLEAVNEAKASLEPAWVTFGYGRCTLATNRDFWDDEAKRIVCGFNPGMPVDTTLLVGRVTANDGRIRATLMNYACHPTTLAWENKLLSPDYVGAAREIMENIYGAPSLFLQGASGELAPRDDFVGDAAIADRNGRQLGYAAAAALESLPPPATLFKYKGIMPSGANLGVWDYEPIEESQLVEAKKLVAQQLILPLKLKEVQTKVDALTDENSHQEREKAQRRYFLQLAVGTGPYHDSSLWVWRLGNVALVAVPQEPYSFLQVELRRRFPNLTIIVMGVANGNSGYLPPRELYGKGIYQEQQTPYEAGALEQVLEEASKAISGLFA